MICRKLQGMITEDKLKFSVPQSCLKPIQMLENNWDQPFMTLG